MEKNTISQVRLSAVWQSSALGLPRTWMGDHQGNVCVIVVVMKWWARMKA